jgi:predicted Zn-dependent peptidase
MSEKRSIDVFKVDRVKCINIHNPSGIAFFGIAMRAGSNKETPEIAGVSHFIEHMLFKGTETRDYAQITTELTKLGVSPNAYTNYDEVLYHATFPDKNTKNVIEIMSDMVFNSTFPEEEIEKERNVILEEKKMYEDDNNAFFWNSASRHYFNWQKGHDIIGEFSTIESIKRQDMVDYLSSRCNPENMIFIFCGDIDSDRLHDYIFESLPTVDRYRLLEGYGINEVPEGLWKEGPSESDDKFDLVVKRANITQCDLYMFCDGVPIFDEDYAAYRIMNRCLGGGMYSLLGMRIREELGLCYSVGMSGSAMAYPDDVVNMLYGGTSEKNVEMFIEESEKVIAEFVKNGIDQDTFECAHTSSLVNILKATETSRGKAKSIFKPHLYGYDKTIEEALKEVENVTIEDVNRLAQRVFANGSKDFRWSIMCPEESEIGE